MRRKDGAAQTVFFEVQNEVGLGRQEEAYHQACKLWLEEHEIPHARKPPHRLMLEGQEAYVLHPDFVIWDSITVELKAVPRKLSQAEFVQLFDYLKFRRDRIGLLVNMGLDRVQVERVAYDPPTMNLDESWTYWTGLIDGRDRDVGIAVHKALQAIYDSHGTGYGDEVTQRLIFCALTVHGLRFQESPVSKAYYRNVEVGESPLNCLVIENNILLTYTTLFDNNQFAISRGLSYLSALNLEWGIAVNFGKRTTEFTGLHRATS
jgi:GxxExxY protein